MIRVIYGGASTPKMLNVALHGKIKNYVTYNNKRKEQVFANNSMFQIKSFRKQVKYSKSQIASNK